MNEHFSSVVCKINIEKKNNEYRVPSPHKKQINKTFRKIFTFLELIKNVNVYSFFLFLIFNFNLKSSVII